MNKRPLSTSRRASAGRRSRTFVTSALALGIIASSLTPIAAVAQQPLDVPSRPAKPSTALTPPADDSPAEQPGALTDPEPRLVAAEPVVEEPIYPTADGDVVAYGQTGTQKLNYDGYASFSDLPDDQRCEHRASAYIRATGPDGTSLWVDVGFPYMSGKQDAFGNDVSELSIDELELYYPGGDVRLDYYGRIANGFDCLNDNVEPSSTDGLVAYKTNTLRIEWEKPEVKRVYTVEGPDSKKLIRAEISPSWTQVGSSDDFGGASIFSIKNYGTDKETVENIAPPCEVTDAPQDDSGYLVCQYSGTYPRAGDAIGIAAIPGGFKEEGSAQWPPAGAVSYSAAVSLTALDKYNAMTQAGAPDSAQCTFACAGDPVDTSTGNFFEADADLAIAGPIGLEVKRRYAVGLLGNDGAFGDGTSLNYDMRLKLDPVSGSLNVVEPSGNETPFAPLGDEYRPLVGGIRADLVKTADGWKFSRWDERLTHVFDADGRLVSIRDDNGNAVAITHDAEDRVSAVTEGDRSLSFAWNGDLLASVEDHTGRKVSYGYTDGRLTSATDPRGNVTEYTYDADGRVLTMTNESGDVTTNVYDAEGRISQQTQPSGQVLDFAYGSLSWDDKQTNTVVSGDVKKTYVYDGRGRIVSFKDSSEPTAEFSRTYDSANNIKTESLIDGTRKSYSHTYSNGDLVKTTESNASSTVLYEYDDQHRLTASVDAAGMRTENAYDDRGNLVQTKVIPTDGNAPRVTSFEIDGDGNTAAIVNPLGGRTVLEYDDADQLTRATDPVGGVTTNSFDSLGRLTETVSPGGNTDGIAPEEKTKFTTSYAYDDAGNVLTVADQSGTTSYQYDEQDRPTKTVDPRGKTKSVVYDAAGEPTKITYPDGSTDEFTYDLDTGLRASWKNPQGLTTTYAYSNGAVTTTSPDGKSSTVATEVDSRYVSTVVTNDKFPSGHEIQRGSALKTSVDPDGKWSTTIEATYDAAGRLVTESQNYNEVAYAYDGFGQLKSRTGQGRDVSYEYDLAGNVTKTVYSDGTEVLHETDLAGRTTEITSWDGTTYDLGYTAGNQLGSMSSSTGLGFTAEHDGTRLTAKNWTNAAGAQIKSFGYQYEASGLMSKDSIDTSERDFSWNDNGALTSVEQDLITWDGKLLTSTGVRNLAYDAATGRLSQATKGSDTTSYQYDAQGNRTKSVAGGTETSYAWNGLNQLTKLDDTAFSYGADGIRTKVGSAVQNYGQDLKLLSDGETKYLWSPDGSLLAQTPLNSTSKADTQQAVTDALGSVHNMLNSQLASVGEYSYTVFGERTLAAGADASSIGFASEQHDDSGLIYLRYRYLDPTVGQFISVDPLVGSTLDPYGYASGNPLQMTDPLGLFSFAEFIGWQSCEGLGNCLYNNASLISTALSGAAIIASATGVGAPIGAALGLASAGFALTSAQKNFSEGKTVDGWVDVAAGTLGLGAFAADLKSANTVTKAIRNGAQSRAEINAAQRTSELIRKNADDAGYGLLAVTTAGKGTLC